ncbi:MAG: thiamine ABC transporter substrate-binding protein [Anaerolineales bacterium]|jgi:thiamine transport system substrate-binding protein
MRRISIFLTLAALAALAACGTTAPSPGPFKATETARDSGTAPGAVLTVMTHDSFEISEDAVAQFESDHDVTVRFLKAGDTGTALNKAILSKDNPLADVFYGVDNTFLSRALEEGIFEPYPSPMLEIIPQDFQLDPSMRALPVDYGDVCINYDRAFYEDAGLLPPESLADLPEGRYRGQLVVENPATSSPGLAFLLATVGVYGEDGYLEYWNSLVANDVLVVNDWESAYYSEFTLHGGTHPLVVSYGSSPPAEVYFAETPLDRAPTGVMTADRSCFRQIEFVGILAGTQQRQLAQAWIDFMLSVTFQENMPLTMFVYPVNPAAALPQVFVENAVIPETTAELAPDRIAANRETWIQDWTEVVLR